VRDGPPGGEGWVDSHGHVHDPAFREDREAVLERAWAAGVAWVLDPAVDLATARQVTDEARRHPGRVWAAVGVHPHEAAHLKAGWRTELQALAREPQVVAIGEVGLDHYRVLSPPEVQEQVLEEQLDLAGEEDLPVILHVRQAYGRILEFLERRPGLRGVVHAFWGDGPTAEAFLARGFYLGLGGALTFRREAGLRQVATALPPHRVLLETDAPYLTPEPLRGRRNEPALVARVGQVLAELWGWEEATVRRVTAENARRLFLGPRSGTAGDQASTHARE
jgi:TatD DNase family protein